MMQTEKQMQKMLLQSSKDRDRILVVGRRKEMDVLKDHGLGHAIDVLKKNVVTDRLAGTRIAENIEWLLLATFRTR